MVLTALPQIEPLTVVNPNYELGQLSSLHVGLDAVGDVDAVLMCLADHPFISTEVIDSLIDASRRGTSGGGNERRTGSHPVRRLQ